MKLFISTDIRTSSPHIPYYSNFNLWFAIFFHSKEEDSPFALAMQNGFAMQNGSKALPNDYDLIPPANWKMATMEEKMISYLMKEYIESNKDKVFRQNSLYTSYEE